MGDRERLLGASTEARGHEHRARDQVPRDGWKLIDVVQRDEGHGVAEGLLDVQAMHETTRTSRGEIYPVFWVIAKDLECQFRASKFLEAF